jgi:DNA-binding MarR family transcriptional regulator
MEQSAAPVPGAISGLVAVIVAADGYRLAAADHFGLDIVESRAVSHLDQRGPISQGQLGRLMGLTSGGVTGVVDRLERRGVARRVADPRDRRRNRVELTEEATHTLGRSRLGLGPAFDQLEPDVVVALAETLPLLAAGLERATEALRATAPYARPVEATDPPADAPADPPR